MRGNLCSDELCVERAGAVLAGLAPASSSRGVSGKVIKGRFIYRETSADNARMTYEIQGDDGKWDLVMEMKASRVR